MLEKPKFLNGEVKEFRNAIKDCLLGNPRNWAAPLVEWENIVLINDLYNQPFQPEMIEKYFKGWNTNIAEVYTNILIDIIFHKQTGYMYIAQYKFPIPQTLAHFISDCLRAGIKLEWRE